MTASYVLNGPFPRAERREAAQAASEARWRAETLRVLRDHLFSGSVSHEELARVAGLMERTIHRAGDRVVREGAPLGALCLVASGTLEVSKGAPRGGQHVLARLGAGEIFGEMSFVDAAPASATIVASTDAVVLRLPRSSLPLCGPRSRAELEGRISRAVVERLRALDGSFAASLQAQLEEARVRHHLERFVLMLVALFGLGQVISRTIIPGLEPAVHMAYSWGFMLAIVLVVVSFMRAHASPAAFGLTWVNGRRSAAEGLVFGVLLAAVVVGWRVFTKTPEEALFTWGSVGTYSSGLSFLFFAGYPLHCFLQELVSRGAVQGSLERFFQKKHRALGTVVTAILFGIFHLHVSVEFALVTFVASLVFGAIYARHRTLVGVTLTHLLLGIASVAVGLN